MKHFIRTVPTMVLAAVVAALIGGGAVIAATQIGSKQIRDNSIRSRDIRDNTVKSRDVRNGTLRSKDLRTGLRERINRPGPQGEPGVSGYEVVGRTADGEEITASQGIVTVTTLCASKDSSSEQQAEVAIAGGAKTFGDVVLNASFPDDIKLVSPPDEDDPAGRWGAGGWTVRVRGTGHVQPYVVCALMN